MTRGRPRTPIGTFGDVRVTDLDGRYRASTRDLDGRLGKVTAVGSSHRPARTGAGAAGRPGREGVRQRLRVRSAPGRGARR